jgi:hypothetical protein
MIDPYFLTIAVGVGLVVCGYLLGRNVGVTVGAGLMFDQLAEMNIIETTTTWEDGEEHVHLMKDGKRVEKS